MARHENFTIKKVKDETKFNGDSRTIIISERDLPTYEAVKFFYLHRGKIGKIVRVEMQEYCRPISRKKSWSRYPMRLIDELGNELRISGLTSGYYGGGPTDTATILQEVWTEIFNRDEQKSKDEISKKVWAIVSISRSFILGDYPSKGNLVSEDNKSEEKKKSTAFIDEVSKGLKEVFSDKNWVTKQNEKYLQDAEKNRTGIKKTKTPQNLLHRGW
jgi:hypothetical protein